MKLTIRRLHWDRDHEARVAAHRVSPAEVEALCRGEPVARHAASDRLVLFGATRAGRDLTVVLAPLAADVYEVVTARPATRRERRYLQSVAATTEATESPSATARAPRIPALSGRREEADWWDAHDLADFLDELTPVELRVSRQLAPPRIGVDDLLAGRAVRGASGAMRHWLQDRLDRMRESERRRKA